MNDVEILKLLATLGIDDMSYKALPLLPLIHVAWADGEIQPAERKLVDEAMAKWSQGVEADRLVQNWLTYPPSQDYVDRGKAALVALAMRDGDLQLDQSILDDVLQLSRAVAKAFGGLWGIGAVTREERAALDAIAKALNVGEGAQWQNAVARELADEPARQRVVIKFNTETLDVGSMPGVLVPVGDPDTQIPVEGTIVLGDDPNCDVVIADAKVAARHAEVRIERMLFYIKDLGDPLGTYVDGERIVERRLLGGETIKLGAAQLRFQLLRRMPGQFLD